VKVVTDGAGHDVPSLSKEETNGMRKIAQANETTDERSAGAVTSEGTPTIGSGTTFIGNVLRLARLRSRKAVARRDLKDTGRCRIEGRILAPMWRGPRWRPASPGERRSFSASSVTEARDPGIRGCLRAAQT
jgi:hypothetical protein